MTFGTRLHAAVTARGPLCAGIDPHAALLRAWGLDDDRRRPGALRADAVEALAPGGDGQAAVRVLRAVRAGASRCSSGSLSRPRRRRPGLLDVKRGDMAPPGRRTPRRTSTRPPAGGRRDHRKPVPRVRVAGPVVRHAGDRRGAVRAGAHLERGGPPVVCEHRRRGHGGRARPTTGSAGASLRRRSRHRAHGRGTCTRGVEKGEHLGAAVILEQCVVVSERNRESACALMARSSMLRIWAPGGLAAGRLQDERGAIVPAGCFGGIESSQNTPSRASVEHVGDNWTFVPLPRCEVGQEVARVGPGQAVLVVAEAAADGDRPDAIVEGEAVRKLPCTRVPGGSHSPRSRDAVTFL